MARQEDIAVARSWLEVTTDEVQSKASAKQRLVERRAALAEQARAKVASTVAPILQQAAGRMGGREYREDHETEWSVVRCGLYAPGEVERDPTVAFHEVEFDAYQPLVILRRKAAGAGALPQACTLRLADLDAEALEAFLAGD